MPARSVLVVLGTDAAWSRGILRGFMAAAHEHDWRLLHYAPTRGHLDAGRPGLLDEGALTRDGEGRLVETKVGDVPEPRREQVLERERRNALLVGAHGGDVISAAIDHHRDQGRRSKPRNRLGAELGSNHGDRGGPLFDQPIQTRQGVIVKQRPVVLAGGRREAAQDVTRTPSLHAEQDEHAPSHEPMVFSSMATSLQEGAFSSPPGGDIVG